MGIKTLHILLLFVGFIASMLIFWPILKISKYKQIVDAPNQRKIQNEPIPVMGGISIFFGILVGLCFFKTFVPYSSLLPVLGVMTIMLYIGAIDDILSISPKLRLVIEIFAALLLIYGTHFCILNFQGLWGLSIIPLWVAILLSVITFLGVVNSINMIDGIDGLSSSFTILILSALGIICYYGDEFSYSALSATAIGAIFPFILHNVFGSKSKMFIGDSGTMMIGTLISAMVFDILRSGFKFNPAHPMDFSRIAFVLSVLSIPIADTLRVMFVRIINGKSPFSPDKNHLHHLLLGINCSHFFITLFEILLNLFVIAVFFISWKLGADIDIQLYAVIITAILADWALAFFLSYTTKKETKTYSRLVHMAEYTHMERKGLWKKIQFIIDFPLNNQSGDKGN